MTPDEIKAAVRGVVDANLTDTQSSAMLYVMLGAMEAAALRGSLVTPAAVFECIAIGKRAAQRIQITPVVARPVALSAN